MLMDAVTMKIHHFQNISMGAFRDASQLAPKMEFVHLIFVGAS